MGICGDRAHQNEGQNRAQKCTYHVVLARVDLDDHPARLLKDAVGDLATMGRDQKICRLRLLDLFFEWDETKVSEHGHLEAQRLERMLELLHDRAWDRAIPIARGLGVAVGNEGTQLPAANNSRQRSRRR